ncbi:MAG: hypothetical protein IJ804_05035 [Prevotella sp.]|nr:hypothetical protein [Prevotella sp.]
MKKYYKIFTLLVVALAGLSLTGCSEDDLDTNPYSKSGVNLLAFGPSPTERASEIRITGTNMQKVDKVVFAGGNIERSGHIITVSGAEVEKADFNSVDNENIYVTIPQSTVPGKVKLVVGKDTVSSVTLLTFNEPVEVTSVSPTTGLNAGDEISITGEYVYNIASVTFTSGVTVPAEDFTYVSRNEIRLIVPLAAESGAISMSNGADWDFEYETQLEIATATVTSVTPAADFGEQIQITGTNLHTVESVFFPGGVSAEFTVSADHKTITATVPAECKSGAISLLLYSGAALTTDEFAVPTVTITSAEPNKDLIEGDVVVLTGENFDRITGVALPGVGDLTPEDYTIEGNTLTFLVPADMTDGDVVLTQNAYITASISIEIRKMRGIVWMGKENLSGWSSWGVFNWDGDKWTKFQEAFSGPGQLTVHMVVTNDNPMYKIRMGDWSTRLSGAAAYESEDGGEWIIHPSADNADLVFDLTADEVATMFGDGGKGIVIWGDGVQLQYVKFEAAGNGVTLWSGELGPTNWSGDKTIPLTDDIKAQLEPGKLMGIEFRCDEGGGQVEICGSWWTGLEGPKRVYGRDGDGRAIMNFAADVTKFEWELIQEDIDILTTQGAILFVGNGGLTITRWYVK